MPATTTLTDSQRRTAILVVVVATCAVSYGVAAISSALLYIVALPGIFGYGFWYATYLRNPTRPAVVLPPFMLSVAAFHFHLVEEYRGGYPLAISRIFNFAWTDFAFFATVCVLSGVLLIVCIGLYYQKPLSGFLAILFLVTRLAEIALFIFPYVRPALQPDNPNPIAQSIHGMLLSNMPSYYYSATQHYYFPGMYTFLLVLLPAVYTLYRIWAVDKRETHVHRPPFN
ncbi:hypothetical protein [Spirosoma jeollabukense]